MFTKEFVRNVINLLKEDPINDIVLIIVEVPITTGYHQHQKAP